MSSPTLRALILCLTFGCNAGKEVEDPYTRRFDDRTTEDRVRAALSTDDRTFELPLRVEVRGGVAHLTGRVDRLGQKAAAERVASEVGGVGRVASEVVVTDRPPAPDDALLAARVKGALVAHPNTPARHIRVEVLDGVVLLSGFVRTAQQKADAGEVADHLDGVREVQNEILVASTVPRRIEKPRRSR